MIVHQSKVTAGDPSAILARAPMRWLQLVGVALCVCLNALDGFDVLSISFASPGIAKEWGIDRAALGVVLSAELVGMAIGSIAIGALADRIGRRSTILGSLTLMAAGMLAAAYTGDLLMLLGIRLITGVGIGGMLACTNAMAAELSNAKNRDLSVTMMAAGYPLGAVLGGTVASMLLAHATWRAVFELGGLAAIILLPAIFLFLPESPIFLARRGGPDALERANRILIRMGHATSTNLSDRTPTSPSLIALFGPGLAATTTLLCVVYLAHIMTFYYILKWVPKIVVDLGFNPSQAGMVLVWANVGGAIGAIGVSLLTRHFDVRYLATACLLLSALLVTLFGLVPANPAVIAGVACGAGICTNGAVVAIYALIANCYPAELRAGGTGVVIGVGRGGAALGPVIAGFLFNAGAGLLLVSAAMAAGSLIAAGALQRLPRRPESTA